MSPEDASGQTHADSETLHSRVIALEHLLITLMAQTSDRQLERVSDRVRAMASYISPPDGYTEHPLTLQAAAQMLHLVERSRHFRGPPDM